MSEYNIYCDESCHLEHDKSPIMVLGAIYCPSNKKVQIYNDIRNIKKSFGLSSYFEIKWTKVSESKVDFYEALLDYFWKNNDLHYRGLVATGKDWLDHNKYNDGDYDLWYYKMYFLLLDPILLIDNEYSILIDIKDTRGGKRVQKLQEVLCNNKYDFNQEVVKRIGQIDSRESEILQITDLINGALAYHHRHLEDDIYANQGKASIVSKLQSKLNLDKTTPRHDSKFNLFLWSPRGVK